MLQGVFVRIIYVSTCVHVSDIDMLPTRQNGVSIFQTTLENIFHVLNTSKIVSLLSKLFSKIFSMIQSAPLCLYFPNYSRKYFLWSNQLLSKQVLKNWRVYTYILIRTIRKGTGIKISKTCGTGKKISKTRIP